MPGTRGSAGGGNPPPGRRRDEAAGFSGLDFQAAVLYHTGTAERKGFGEEVVRVHRSTELIPAPCQAAFPHESANGHSSTMKNLEDLGIWVGVLIFIILIAGVLIAIVSSIRGQKRSNRNRTVVHPRTKGKVAPPSKGSSMPIQKPKKFRVWFRLGKVDQNACAETVRAWVSAQNRAGTFFATEAGGTTNFEVEPNPMPGIDTEAFLAGLSGLLLIEGKNPDDLFYLNDIALFPEFD